jgi:dTMP kinase
MTSAKFITLEGGEGGGKSTQAGLLADRLRRHGLDVVQSREPGGSPRAEAIRETLLSGKARRFGPLAEAVLFYAARQSHLELTIRPALSRGAWIVCDRFSDSTRAYQGAAGGVSDEVLDAFEQAIVGESKPDLTLILDLPPEESVKRIAARAASGGQNADRFESMGLTFHESLRDEFLAIARAEPKRCAVIDATPPVGAVAQTIWSTVRDRLLT